jgi:hypothetical protein
VPPKADLSRGAALAFGQVRSLVRGIISRGRRVVGRQPYLLVWVNAAKSSDFFTMFLLSSVGAVCSSKNLCSQWSRSRHVSAALVTSSGWANPFTETGHRGPGQRSGSGVGERAKNHRRHRLRCGTLQRLAQVFGDDLRCLVSGQPAEGKPTLKAPSLTARS